ncbi:hypothetical protein ACM43_11140 [Bradyrhizobium sp. CCBAU 45321]|uniref:RES family NAD+ phosphorylase n=1 Tax=Bradyrhizobium TaxID=374 RepID=UPI0006886506|nr:MULTISPECIES: RES family NAD+ phosphorylase [Bradyrhizobium]MDA9545017.1 hypothetical protein [Bradyrhizobium sp. CCBAU 45321]
MAMYSKRSFDQDCYQLIPSRFPTIEVYERLGDEQVQSAAKALEERTNPRLAAIKQLPTVPKAGEKSASQYQNWNHAPFAYKDPRGTFFLGPTLGCLELASDMNTALAFALLRREEFLGSTCEPAMGLDMRVFSRRITGSFHDLTKLDPNLPKAERWKIGHQLHDSGSPGILFRRPGFGEHRFLAVFDGALLPRAVQGAHYRFVWDGQKIKSIYDFSDGKEILRGGLLAPAAGRDAAE